MTNWGRWGNDDERGAANLLDPSAVLAAAAEIRTGEVLRLAAPIVGGRGFGLVGRPDPVHLMLRDGERMGSLLEVCALAAKERVERVTAGPAVDPATLASAVMERMCAIW